MRTTAVIFCLLTLCAARAVADELPTNLLLKCEGRVSIIMPGILPKDDKFETMLRLKNKVLSDLNSIWLTTKDCVFQNSIVHCSERSVVSISVGKESERRKLDSYLARETGKYNLFLETWDFDGPNASGRRIGNMKIHRAGVCRQISKPIF